MSRWRTGKRITRAIALDTAEEISALRTAGGGPGSLFPGLPNGQPAVLMELGYEYVLQPSNTTPDGVLVLATRDDPDRRWLKIGGAGGQGVTSLIAGTDIELSQGTGDVTVTSIAIVRVADIAALTALNVAGMTSGCQAFVASTAQTFVLGPAIGTADGRWVIATADDVTRQWGLFGLAAGQFCTFTSDVISAAATSAGLLVAPALTGKTFVPQRYSIDLTGGTLSGTISTAASIAIGTDPAHANFVPATAIPLSTSNFNFAKAFQPNRGYTNTAINGISAVGSPVAAQMFLDVTIAATGSALVWPFRVIMQGFFA